MPAFAQLSTPINLVHLSTIILEVASSVHAWLTKLLVGAHETLDQPPLQAGARQPAWPRHQHAHCTACKLEPPFS
jgi:hypothetical protein